MGVEHLQSWAEPGFVINGRLRNRYQGLWARTQLFCFLSETAEGRVVCIYVIHDGPISS
jgi:hypothetical protein